MRVVADLDLDEIVHRKGDRDRVEARRIAFDHAALFQIFHARPAGRFGEADLLAKVGIGLAAIAFERGDDLPVELVHAFRPYSGFRSESSELSTSKGQLPANGKR